MSVSDAYRDAVNKMRAARGMGPAFHRASDPEAPDIFDAGDDDNNEPKTIEEAADLIRGLGRRRGLDEGIDDKPTAPEGSVARFIVDCAARARGEDLEPAQLPKVAEFDLSPVIAKLLAASNALATDPVGGARLCERGTVMVTMATSLPVTGYVHPTGTTTCANVDGGFRKLMRRSTARRQDIAEVKIMRWGASLESVRAACA